MKQLICCAAILQLLIFSSCNDNDQNENVTEDSLTAVKEFADSTPSLTDRHNAVSSLDWNGTYKGSLPCADCEGIATEIRLGKDLTYILRTSYIGKTTKSIEVKGKFKWDEAGNTISLAGITNRPGKYFVGENYLAQMDMSGKRITGGLADKYILAKQQRVMASADSSYKNATLVETYWKLITLDGHGVAMPAEGKKEVHLILKEKDNRVQGFSGCNTMMGLYELKDANSIHFKNLASTRMACDDMTTENVFKKVLEQVNSYSIEGDNLSLNKRGMPAFATFKAVYLR